MLNNARSHVHWIETACALSLLAAVGCGARLEPAAPTQEAAHSSEAPAASPLEIPAELAVPEGNKLAFTLGAKGVQRYSCPTDGSKWTFVAPEADLFDEGGKNAGHHAKGPTWQALDGSVVAGAQPALASLVVDATAIPWLKLSAASHDGAGRMANVTFVQRLKTKGGLAPTGACMPDGTLDVDYTATYAFYEAAPAK